MVITVSQSFDWLPQINRDHKLGIGIFSVQGFERCNKESKFFYEHHTNCKGNIPQQALSGLDRNFKKRKLKQLICLCTLIKS